MENMWVFDMCGFWAALAVFSCLLLGLVLWRDRMNGRVVKWIGWIFVALALLIVLSCLGFWVEGLRAAKELDEYVAELKSQGVVLDVTDLLSAKPASTQFFNGPVQESAAYFLISGEAAGQGSGVDPGDWPWYEISLMARHVFELKAEEYEQIRKTVEAQQELIARLKKVSELPPTRIEDTLQAAGMRQFQQSARIPNLLACRGFADLLLLDAYVAYEDGRLDDALKSCGHILELGKHVADFPIYISNTIEISMTDPVPDFLAHFVLDGDFSDQAVESFAALLDRSMSREPLALALTGELLSGRRFFSSPTELADHIEGPEFALRAYGLPLFRYIRATDERVFLNIMCEAVMAVEWPYYENKSADWQETLNDLGWNTPLSKMLIPNVKRASLARAHHELQLLQLKVALAANRHAKDTGVYPESVSDLITKHLQAIPVNPLTGEEMTLKRMSEEATDESQETDDGRRLLHFFIDGPDGCERLLIE